MRPFTPHPPQQVAPADTTAAAAPDTTASLLEEARSSFDMIEQTLLDPSVWLSLLGTTIRILLILLIAVLLLRLIRRGAKKWMAHFEDLPVIDPGRQRAYTLGNLFMSTSRYIIWPVVAIMVLSEFNINVGALLATAGIAGLAIGFGAQTLVRDVISGVFLLFDDSLHVGDTIRIGSDQGTVDFIGVRMIKVRKFDGELLMVPAGELRIFGNRSVKFSRLIVEVDLAYEQDLESVLPDLEQIAADWAEAHRANLLEDGPTVQAITALESSSVRARIVVQMVPGTQYEAERDLRRRIKREFDRLGIEIPFPRQTLYLRQETKTPARNIADDAS